MATSYLTRAAQTATSNTTATISAWIKRSHVGTSGGGTVWMHENVATHNNKLLLFFSGAVDQISMQSYNGSAEYILTPTRKLRDVNGWYHIVAIWNTTASTTADRMQIWINGVRETSFTTANYPSQNATVDLSTKAHQIGRYVGSGGVSNYWDGYMTQFVYADGQAYDASYFGETDANGVWKPKTDLSGLTYGNRGVWLKMEDSSNLGLDSSGNSNNYTNSGVTQTQDNPSHVFATWNPLEQANNNFSYANGNTYSNISFASGYNYVTSTLGAATGKYYCEMKANTTSGSNKWLFGIATHESLPADADYLGKDFDAYGYRCSNGNYYNNDTTTVYGNSCVAGDIVGVAMDLDNNRLFFSVNGVWQNSADPTSSTGAISIVSPSSTLTGFYHFAWGDIDATGVHTMYANFGNGYFGTTAVSSAGTNASGNGIFEYDCPTGYTALSTKGLNL